MQHDHAVTGDDLLAPGFPGCEDFVVREGREEGGEEVVAEDAGCVELGDGGEEVGVGGGVVESGWWEGHFWWFMLVGRRLVFVS